MGQTKPVALPIRRGGIQIRSAEELWTFSVKISKSGLAPKGMERPEQVFAAVELGLELGLPAMSALQNIAVINGRPGVFGDAALALVMASGLCVDFNEWMEEREDGDKVAMCSAQRFGREVPIVRSFSVADAKRARLWGKPGPWTEYTDRMLMFRARGYCLRDAFPDVLKGIKTVEELQDYPETAKGATVVEMPPKNQTEAVKQLLKEG